MRFVLKGSVPSKKNSKRIFARGNKVVVIPSERHELWYADATRQINQQNVEKIHDISEPVELTVEFYYSTKRKKDSDNSLSSLLDLLVGNHILADDNYSIVNVIHVYNFSTSKENGDFTVVQIDLLK